MSAGIAHQSRNSKITLGATVTAGVILVATMYTFLVNAGALDLPPAWDSATTVSPAALTIVEFDFDVWEVAELPGTLEGGPSTHATSLYTIGLALLIELFGASSGFFLAHLASILMGAALVWATFLLARERLTLAASGVVALSVSLLPIVLQQTADVYLDLPLSIVTTLTFWAVAKRKFWLTVVLVVLGVAIKTSAVFLIPLLLMARPRGKRARRHLTHAALASLIALVPFAVAFVTTDRFDTAPTLYDRLFLLWSGASLLVLTVDVLLILVVYTLVVYGRFRNHSLDRISKVSVVLVAGFLAAHLATVILSATITVLPRYYIDILPVVLVTLVPNDLWSGVKTEARHVTAVAFLAILMAFSLVNRRGDLYPLPDHNFFVAAERSTRAQDLLALQVEGTRRLVDKGLPIVVGHQEHFRVEYPGMGYVTETPNEVISLIHNWPSQLPETFAMLIEPRVGNRVVEFEEDLLANGYHLSYEELQVGGYRSKVAVVTAPDS